nr:MAG TPA: minor tail protein [Caudoviricetes sp.]
MALEERGTRITLKADISQLKTAFNKMNALARESKTELRKIGQALKFDPHNVALLTQKQHELNRVVAQNYKLIGNLKKQIEKHVQLGETREVKKLTTQLEILRSVNESFKTSLKETKSILSNIGSISGLAKLDKELQSSRSNVERLNKALKLDTTNVSNLAHKFLELQAQEDSLLKKTHILTQDLKKIDFKVNPQGYQELKSKLEQAKAEATQVRLELDKLGGTKFNPVIAQLEKLDNEIKKSRESSKLLKQALDIKPTSLTKSMHLEEARTQLDKTREKIKLLKNELSKVNTNESRAEFIKLTGKIAESEKQVKDLIHSVGILNAKRLDGVRGSFSAIGSSIEGNAQKIANFGRNFTFGYTLPVTYGAKKVVDSFVETDNALRRVAAAASDGVASKFTKSFGEIEVAAKKASDGSVYSIKQVASGMEELIKANWSQKDAQEQVINVMNLAKVEGMELAQATEIVADGLASFGLKANETARFTDVLTTASIKSTTDITKMGETLKYVAPIAGTLGYSIEDTATAIAIMASNGIKASVAGTSLRGGLTNLVKPSAEAKAALDKVGFSMIDANGNTKPFLQVISELREKTNGMTKAQKQQFAATVFGKTAMSGWLAILNASKDSIDDVSNSIKNSTGATKEMADQLNSGAGGAIEKFKAALSNAAYETGKAWGPALKSVVDGATQLLKAFNESSDGTKRFITGLIGITAAAAPLTWAIGGLISPFIKFKNLLSTLRTAKTVAEMGEVASKGGLLARTFAAIPPQMKLYAGAALLLGGGLLYLKNQFDPLVIAQRKAQESADKVGEAFNKVGQAAKDFGDKIKQSSDVFETTFGTNNKFTENINKLAADTQTGFDKIRSILNQATSENREITRQEAQDIGANYNQLVSSLNQRVQAESQGYSQVVQIARNAAANKAISDSAYETQFASHISKIGQIHETSKQNTQQWYDALVAINSQLPPELQLNMDKINEVYQNALVRDRENYNKSSQAAIQAYSERYNIENGFINDLRTAKAGMEEVERQHQQRTKENHEHFRGDIEIQHELDSQEDKRYADEKAWHYQNLEGKFDEHRIKQIGQWLAAIQENTQNGGELTNSQAKNVQDFLATMNNLPEETRNKITQGLKDAGIDIDTLGASLAAQMQKHGVSLNNQFASGLLSEKPSVDNAIQVTLNAVTDSVNRASLLSEGQRLMLTGRDGIAAGKPAVDTAMSAIMEGAKSKVQNTNMSPVGREKSQQLGQGIKSADGEVWNAASQTANHGKNGAQSVSFNGVGESMTIGMANGASSQSGTLLNTMRSLASAAWQAAKAALGINSPSRVFKREIGYWIAPGIAEGVTSNAGTLYTSIKDTMLKGVQTAKNFNFSEKLSNMVDFKTAGNYAIQHSVSQNTSVIETLNVLINKVNDLELRSDVYLDGDKIGNATYKRHEVIDRRLGLV